MRFILTLAVLLLACDGQPSPECVVDETACPDGYGVRVEFSNGAQSRWAAPSASLDAGWVALRAACLSGETVDRHSQWQFYRGRQDMVQSAVIRREMGTTLTRVYQCGGAAAPFHAHTLSWYNDAEEPGEPPTPPRSCDTLQRWPSHETLPDVDVLDATGAVVGGPIAEPLSPCPHVESDVGR